MQTNTATYKIIKITESNGTEGQFTYFDIKQRLQSCVNNDIHNSNNTLSLIINIDGIKLFKSSAKIVWPILVKVYFEPDVYSPFVTALYSRNHKPKNVEEFLY